MSTENAGYMFKDIDLTPVLTLLKNYDISGWFKNNEGGNTLRFFQRSFAEYCQTKYAFATSSGSSAIYVALRACNVGRGDAVIVPAYTHIGTVAPVVLAGARPIFADVDEHGNIDAEYLPFNKAKAIIVVHQLGMPCDMDAIKAEFDGKIIEDASHALGAEYKGKRAGSLGDVAAFSIGGGRTKTIGTGEGGMVTTNNEDLAEKCKNIRNHGDRVTDCDYMCFNFRMSELNALIGLLQMPRLDMLNEWQLRNSDYMRENLPDFLEVPNAPSYAKTTRYIIGCMWNAEKAGFGRNEFIRRLAEKKWDGGVPRMNIGSGYSKLIYDIRYYQKWKGEPLAMSEKIRDNSVWIDWHRYPRTRADMDELLEHIKAVWNETS